MPASNLTSQIAVSAVAVTPSDTVANAYSYLYVGTGGNVAIADEDGNAAVTYVNVPSGSYLWVRTRLVMSTNTTASNIIGHD